MKNKLIFRILGALASALIIVSVFVPFISVAGHSPSLWETYEVTNSLYLPITIIVFGAIGVIFFALNIKTEFAYTSVGAIAFFVIIQTIDILDQGNFKSLSIGYYFLIIGAFFTGLMAFLNNLKSNNKVQVVEETKKEDVSMLEQIDKLYNDQTTNQSEISPIQPIANVIQPLPIQPVEQMIEQQPIVEVQPQNIQVVQEPVVEQTPVSQSVNPVLQEFNTPMVEETKVEEIPVVEQQPVVETPVSQPVNPMLQEFSVPSVSVTEETTNISEQPVNPILQEFAQATNPVLQEFGISSNNVVEQPSIVEEQPALNQEIETVPISNINEPVNPTVQEFNNPGFIATQQQNSTEFDIFGQPINKS